MIGFCLAAGAGSRLLPLTRVTPKPLLAPAGRPLVDLAIEALQRAGATRVVVNAHHGADLLVAHLAGRPRVEVVVEPVLLGTGGGLVNAAHLGLLGAGGDPVLVTAADHVVDPADLAALAAFLDGSGAPMAAGRVPATVDPFALRLVGEGAAMGGRPAAAGRGSLRARGEAAGGGSVARDPDGPWDSAGVYALRAGPLLDLEPGPATLVERVLGPLLDAMLKLADSPTSRVDLIAKGSQAGSARGWFYDRSAGAFQSDRRNETLSAESLIDQAGAGSELTFTLVARGTGQRLGIDRDSDGVYDGDELDAGTNPADPQSNFQIESIILGGPSNSELLLSFTAVSNHTYSVQFRDRFDSGPWSRWVDVVAYPSNRFVTLTNSLPAAAESRAYRLVTPQAP